MAKRRVVVIGAAGFLAGRVLPTFRQRYDLVLLDVTTTNRDGDAVEDVQVADLVDTNRDAYRAHFRGADTIVHCGNVRRRDRAAEPAAQRPPTPDVRFQTRPRGLADDAHFDVQMKNIQMAHNIYRVAIDEGVRRVVMLSSNHASDFYERLIWKGQLPAMIDPGMRALSDNIYGWAKGAYESLGFTFASGMPSDGRPLEVVQVRIGGPRETDWERYDPDRPEAMHRSLGAYLSARDQVQLMVKCIETEDIRDEHGVPFQVFYGISGNTHRFWDLSNAINILGYEPEDDSAVKFSERIAEVNAQARRSRYGE